MNFANLDEHKGVMKDLRSYFVAGLLVIVPFSLTVFIIYQVFLAIDGILQNIIFNFLRSQFGLDSPLPGLGFLTLLLLIFGAGVLARNYFGNRLIHLGEKIVTRIPLINRVYLTIQQISHAFFGEKREVFKKAVLFEYPRPGIYSIGFFTQDTKGEVQNRLDEDVVSIFLPTTPNPTSGFLLFVPKKDIIELQISVEDALKLVISGGAIVPGKTDHLKARHAATVEQG